MKRKRDDLPKLSAFAARKQAADAELNSGSLASDSDSDNGKSYADLAAEIRASRENEAAPIYDLKVVKDVDGFTLNLEKNEVRSSPIELISERFDFYTITVPGTSWKDQYFWSHSRSIRRGL